MCLIWKYNTRCNKCSYQCLSVPYAELLSNSIVLPSFLFLLKPTTSYVVAVVAVGTGGVDLVVLEENLLGFVATTYYDGSHQTSQREGEDKCNGSWYPNSSRRVNGGTTRSC